MSGLIQRDMLISYFRKNICLRLIKQNILQQKLSNYKASAKLITCRYNSDCDMQDMHTPKGQCSDLTEITADAIDYSSLKRLFISVQMNSCLLWIKQAIKNTTENIYKLHSNWKPLIEDIIISFGHF
ncbi:hypothetical protein AcV7_006137 [Taiwanofungus camphoratus]|nr:hypothetical protein AcV7_006137 [Antrodia cinnamomea]